jgi:peptide/nickel transport system substrate-binding protein
MFDIRSTIAAIVTGLVVVCAGPAAAENVLRFTGKDAWAATMDPHAYADEDNKGATYQVYEALLDIDSNLAVVPQLAVAWQILDPTHWEFELRQGVRFQDGTPFSADDVVFSIERAQAKTSDFRDRVGGIAAVEAADDHTIRITTMAPDPSLWLKLADVAMMSKAWAQAHDVTNPADFVGAREETYASRHANGTGPFVLQSFEPRGGWVMVRNPDWWGAADYPDNNIDRIVHVAKRDPENVAALLDGEIDLLQTVPYWALPKIRADSGLKLAYRPKLLTMFFGLDQGSAELRSSNVKGRNPFKDRRVREAMAHALDMKSALHELMGELFVPAGMIAAPGVNGWSADLDQPIAYDPDKAKALLAEAGYPDGFSVTLDCFDDTGDDEITACKAAAQQLGAVGIETAVKFMSFDEWDEKVYKRRESDFHLDGWHMDLDSEEVLKKMYYSRNELNIVGYANPRVDELIDKIGTTMVTYARDAYLEEAWRIVTDDFVYLPIRHGVSVFAMRKNLEIPPDPWDVPRFRLAHMTPRQ